MRSIRTRSIRIETDAPAIAFLARQCLEIAWTKSDLVALFRLGGFGLIAETLGSVAIGYGICVTGEPGSCRILDLCVEDAFRRQGIGIRLVGELCLSMHNAGNHHVETIVPESNLGGQLFCRAAGFRATGCFRGALREGTADAFHFEYWIGRRVPAGGRVR